MAECEARFVDAFVEQTQAIARMMDQGDWEAVVALVAERAQLLEAHPAETMHFNADERARIAELEALNQTLTGRMEAYYAELRGGVESVRNQIRLNRHYGA